MARIEIVINCGGGWRVWMARIEIVINHTRALKIIIIIDVKRLYLISGLVTQLVDIIIVVVIIIVIIIIVIIIIIITIIINITIINLIVVVVQHHHCPIYSRIDHRRKTPLTDLRDYWTIG